MVTSRIAGFGRLVDELDGEIEDFIIVLFYHSVRLLGIILPFFVLFSFAFTYASEVILIPTVAIGL